MKEPSLQHGMSAEFEITNKTQKELQHTISIVASMVTSREMGVVANGLKAEDAALLSSLIGITEKHVHEKMITEATERTNNLLISYERKSPSGEKPQDQDRNEWDVPIEYHGTPFSYGSSHNKKSTPIMMAKHDSQEVEQQQNKVINLKSIDINRKRVPNIGSDIEILRIGPEIRNENQKSAYSPQDDAKKRSRSKERYPVPISISKDVLHSHRGDLDEPNA
jgi:hypothetical protein